ncbi:MAG: hypothetical protein KU37_07250 [Sulfuricurvum sp. PC08-66]|nr:MAG: hypothetical protein KU37_07250 [Sulfuricurvum sp. PC08-66]
MRRSAFTLMELVFVILIMGILSTIGVDIFVRIYSTYATSQAKNRIHIDTALAIEKIAHRLEFRIKDSLIIGNIATDTFNTLALAPTPLPDRFSFEWIGYDNDSLLGMGVTELDDTIWPAVNGFIDLDSSSSTLLVTTGSNLDNASEMVYYLSGGDINLTDCDEGNNSAVLIFPDATGSVAEYGWYGNNPARVHPVCHNDGNITTFNVPTGVRDFGFGGGTEVFERYTFSYSAYALELNATSGELWLYTNYQPWNGERYTDGNASLLMENVSTFQLRQVGDILQLQLCIETSSQFRLGWDDNNTLGYCKDKVIY